MRYLIVLLLSLMLAVPAAAQFSFLGIKNSMVQFLFDQLSTEGEFEIKAEQVEEPEDGVTAITGLTIADGDGIWFTAESLDFSWSPSRLLLGEIEFSRLGMRGVRVLRPPVSQVAVDVEEEPADEAQGLTIEWPRSPLTLRVESLTADDVQIAETVLGHALAFDAQGAAQDEGDVQSVRLDITRRDAVEGEIKLDYERRFDTNTFRLNLDAREGPAGLIAALSGLPSDAATVAEIAADGPPEDWRMNLDISLAETLDLTGNAAISYEGPLKVDATLDATAGPQLDPDLAALLGSGANLQAKAAEGPDGTILIERGQLRSPDLGLIASGSYSRTTGEADLKLDLQARSGLADPVEGVDFESFGFVGTVKGAPGTFAADGDLTLRRLATAPADVAEAALAIDVRQSGPTETPTTSFAVEGTTAGLRLDKIGADVLGDPRIDVTGALTGNELTLTDARLASNVLTLAVQGRADLDTTDASVTLNLAAPEFQKVADAYGVEVAGTVAVEGRALYLGGALDAALTAELSRFEHPQASADTLAITALVHNKGTETLFDVTGAGTEMRLDKIRPELLGTLDFAAKGGVDGDALTLEDARVTSDLLEAGASGDMNLADQTGRFEYTARTVDLAPITALYDVALGGQAVVDGVAVLAEAPRIDGVAGIDGLVFDGTSYGNLALDHDVTVGEEPEGDILLTLADSPYGQVDFGTHLKFAAPVLELTKLDLKALGATANGDLTLDTEKTLIEGAIKLAVANLKSLQDVTGAPLAGAVRGDIRLSHNGTRQDATAVLGMRNLITDGAAIASVDLKATLSDVLGTPAVDAVIDAVEISAGDVALSDVKATARGRLAALDITANLNGTLKEDPLTATIAARADAEGPAFGARISTLEAALAEETLSLNQPLNVRAEGAVVTLKDLDLTLPRGGTLVGDITKYGSGIRGAVTLANLDATLAKRFADAPVLSGMIGAEATFDTGRGPADVTLNASGMRFENVDVDGTLDLATRLTWDGRRAQASGDLTGGFGDPFRFEGSFPLRPGLVPQVPTSGPVDGRVTWQGQIGNLWALVPAPGHILTGDMNIDLAISGDISDPQLGGQVAVTDGGYQNLDLGTILTDLTLTTQAEPGGALGFELKASDGGEGSVQTEGEVALDASGIDIRTTIDKAVLVRRDEATARIDGGLTIVGPVNALKVDGDIELETVEVRLIANPSVNIVDLGEVRIKGAPEPEVETEESTVDLRLDITSPGRVFVRGRGLDSTWNVDLKIRGTAAQPRLTGSVDRVRGRLDLIGKAFDLSRGSITFDGRRKIDPRLDIAFERETADLTGRILIGGRASEPTLGFSSSPSLPEDEVLPRTIFGKSSQSLTGSQAIQLAIGLATLMDGGGGTLDKVRGAVGLDQLRVEQDDDGNASVAAGKEVAEGVFVGAKQGLTSNETSVVVEIDVFENFSIDAEVGQQSGSTVGVGWKKDF